MIANVDNDFGVKIVSIAENVEFGALQERLGTEALEELVHAHANGVQADDELILAHADDLGPAYPTGNSSGALRIGATFGTSATLYAFTTYQAIYQFCVCTGVENELLLVLTSQSHVAHIP